MQDNDTLALLEQAGVITNPEEATPPPTDTPATEATPPAEQQPEIPSTPAQPQFNFDEELVKNTNGAIKSTTDLAALLEKSSQYKDFESRYKALGDEKAALEAKTKVAPFANDYVKKLDALYRGGASDEQIQAFNSLNKVKDFESLSPYEAKIMALQIKEGLTASEAKVYVDSTYNLNPDEHEADVIAREQIRLKVDARADREFLKTQQVTASTPPASQEEANQRAYQEQAQAHIQKLEPLAKTVVKDIAFNGININGKAGDNALTADFKPSPESLQLAEQHLKSFIESRWDGIPADEKGVEAMNGFVKNALIVQNWETWLKHATNVTEKKVREEYHNPSTINRGTNNPNVGKSERDTRSDVLKELYPYLQ